MENRTDSGRSPWVWVGCGCAVVLVGALLALGGAAWLGVRAARDVARDMEDPAARDAKAGEVLGVEQLPEPYRAVVAFEVPFLMELAVLSDLPPDEDGDQEFESDRLFLLLRFRDFGGAQRSRLERFLDGREPDLDLDLDVDVDARLVGEIGRGTLELDGGPAIRWRADRAEYEAAAGRREGTQSVFLADCSGRERLVFGLWLRPLGDGADVGTTESALREMLGPLRLCRDS